MEKEYTAGYDLRKGYVTYDREHVILYLNEEATEDGLCYTGTLPDGGTLIAASGITDANRRDKFIAGLIGVRYDMDAQMALLANGTDTEEHARELEAFSAWRARAKAMVDELLARGE